MSDVSLVKLEPTFMAAVRKRTTLAQLPRQIRSYFDVVYAAIRAGKVTKGGHNVALYRNASEQGVDVECGVQVPARFDNVGAEVACREIPGGEVATTTHFGAYDRLGDAHDRVMRWIEKSGRERTGICWEVYGDWHEDPARVRTDVYWLLKPQ